MNEINKGLKFEGVLTVKSKRGIVSHFQTVLECDKIEIMPEPVVKNQVEKEQAEQQKSKKKQNVTFHDMLKHLSRLIFFNLPCTPIYYNIIKPRICRKIKSTGFYLSGILCWRDSLMAH